MTIGETTMERMYAFTDEYGAFGYDLDNPSVSTHFIITAVIVRESDLKAYSAGAEGTRKKYFQTGEIKSSKLGPEKHHRRMLILQDISALPMNFLTICIDKRGCMENMNAKGPMYKPTFYKFMNNIVHRELRQAYSTLTIIADEVGTYDYMKSFCNYVSRHQDQANLLGDANFMYRKYFSGCTTAYAFVIGSFEKYPTSKSLADFNIQSAPQSFVYLDD